MSDQGSLNRTAEVVDEEIKSVKIGQLNCKEGQEGRQKENRVKSTRKYSLRV